MINNLEITKIIWFQVGALDKTACTLKLHVRSRQHFCINLKTNVVYCNTKKYIKVTKNAADDPRQMMLQIMRQNIDQNEDKIDYIRKIFSFGFINGFVCDILS